ncbi:MAG: 50S ribosomal protein L5 [Blastochloris sp.]|nr:50S ribosomal protein L5 [Blastochloris sp.]
MAPRLKERYLTEIVPALTEEFKFKTVMQVPRLQKIVLNIGLGEALQNPKALDAAVGDLGAISGQKPVVTRAKKAIAAFKLREGMPIGAMVTLRGNVMYEFADRLINLALPRIRDFRGVSRRSFDGRGNYSLGLREQIIFPEIDYDKVDKIRGLEVAIVTNAADDAQGYALLKRLACRFGIKASGLAPSPLIMCDR